MSCDFLDISDLDGIDIRGLAIDGQQQNSHQNTVKSAPNIGNMNGFAPNLAQNNKQFHPGPNNFAKVQQNGFNFANATSTGESVFAGLMPPGPTNPGFAPPNGPGMAPASQGPPSQAATMKALGFLTEKTIERLITVKNETRPPPGGFYPPHPPNNHPQPGAPRYHGYPVANQSTMNNNLSYQPTAMRNRYQHSVDHLTSHTTTSYQATSQNNPSYQATSQNNASYQVTSQNDAAYPAYPSYGCREPVGMIRGIPAEQKICRGLPGDALRWQPYSQEPGFPHGRAKEFPAHAGNHVFGSRGIGSKLLFETCWGPSHIRICSVSTFAASR